MTGADIAIAVIMVVALCMPTVMELIARRRR